MIVPYDSREFALNSVDWGQTGTCHLEQLACSEEPAELKWGNTCLPDDSDADSHSSGPPELDTHQRTHYFSNGRYFELDIKSSNFSSW